MSNLIIYAFPSPDVYHPNGQIEYGNVGMTLRDYFAAKALASMDYGWFGSSTRIQEMSEESYVIADAMIEARETKPKEIIVPGYMIDALQVIRTVATQPHHEDALKAIQEIANNTLRREKGELPHES